MFYLLCLAGGIIAGFLIAALLLRVQLRQQETGTAENRVFKNRLAFGNGNVLCRADCGD